MFDDFSTVLFFILAGAFLLHVFDASGRKNNGGSIANAMNTLYSGDVFLFYLTVNFFNELQTNKAQIIRVKDKTINGTLHLLQLKKRQ